MSQPKHYWPWWTWVLLAFTLWLIMFVAFLRQAYIRITEEEGRTQTCNILTNMDGQLRSSRADRFIISSGVSFTHASSSWELGNRRRFTAMTHALACTAADPQTRVAKFATVRTIANDFSSTGRRTN